MDSNKYQNKNYISQKAAIALIWLGAILLLLMAACTSSSAVSPTPTWQLWRWQPSPSPIPILIDRFRSPTSTPDPFHTQTATVSLPAWTDTPSPSISDTTIISLTSMPSKTPIPSSSPTMDSELIVVASYIRQQLVGSRSIFTSLPDQKGITHVRWWGQNTQLTICTKFSIQVGNVTITPTLDMSYIVYNPDNLQQILTAIDVPTKDPSIVCGLIGKQKLSDKSPFNPYEINKDGVFGIGYLKNGQIIPVTIADTMWIGGKKTPGKRFKLSREQGSDEEEFCKGCH